MKTAAALLLTLAAPVAARPAPPPSASDYLHGRLAAADNRFDDAARYYAAALEADPGDVALQRRAFDTALAGGDEALATALARQLDAAQAGDAATALVRLADALKHREWAAAAAVKGLPDAGYAAVVPPIVAGWISIGRGDVDGALALVDPAKFSGVARSYVGEHRALMLAAAHRDVDAAPLFATLLAGEARPVVRLRIAAAAGLQKLHRNTDAAAMLAGGDALAPGNAALAAAAVQLKAGRSITPGALDPRQGVAVLMLRLAADLAREKPVPLALTFARVATFLDPTGDAWLVAGDVLLRMSRPQAALAAYDRIPPHDWAAAVVAAHRAAALAELGRNDAARALFTLAATAPAATVDDWQRLGDFERQLDRHAAAADAYGHAVALAGAQADWSLYFLRGAAFEQGGDWAHGEADLRTALRLAPDEPTVLNYLGYALLDRGQKPAEAQALIEHAAALRPDDGFIADSLGWTYYRAGNVVRAVPVLEAAARREPGDATINDHLGDAYWRAGRRIEARFQWRAAASLEPDAAEAKRLAAKLDYGLDVATAMASPHP